MTGELRQDGTFARRYVCRSHHWHRHTGRCRQPRFDADVIEAMFVSALPSLLAQSSEPETESALAQPANPTDWADCPHRDQLIEAVHRGDDDQIDAALDDLLARASPQAAMLRGMAVSARTARELEAVRRFEAWAGKEPLGRTEASRAEAHELKRILRGWFTRVTLAMDARSVVIVAHHRPASSTNSSSARTEARFDRREWMRWSPVARRTHQIYADWEDAEILGALQAWTDAHGRVPRAKDWHRGTGRFPTSSTVARHFGSWNKGLLRAGLAPPIAETRHRWKDSEIIQVLQTWGRQHGRAPTWSDWQHSSWDRPSRTTVCNHFGSWQAGLAAAGVV